MGLEPTTFCIANGPVEARECHKALENPLKGSLGGEYEIPPICGQFAGFNAVSGITALIRIRPFGSFYGESCPWF